MKCSRSDSRPILGFGFVNGGFEILWYEYLWVAISPFGGFAQGVILDALRAHSQIRSFMV